MRRTLLLFLLLAGFDFPAIAQGLVDGFSQEKGQYTFALSYTRENYDEFYFANEKRDLTEVTGLEKIITQGVNLYGAYGISDNVEVIVNFPYISSKSEVSGEDQTVREENMQNASVFTSWKAVESGGDAGTFSMTGAFGISFPLSDYATNQVYSIGHGNASFDPKLVLQYQLNYGLFAQVQGGYSIRTNEVPNAALLSGKVGYGTADFYVEGWFAQQWSTGGIDIGSEGFSPERFPETKVNTSAVNLSAYAKIFGPLGITGGYGIRFDGRNAGLPSWFTLGTVFDI